MLEGGVAGELLFLDLLGFRCVGVGFVTISCLVSSAFAASRQNLGGLDEDFRALEIRGSS